MRMRVLISYGILLAILGSLCSLHVSAAPLSEIQLGVILITDDESHCFMFGGLGLSPEKTKETGFLTGVGYDAAFSADYKPEKWPVWKDVSIRAVYALSGKDYAEKFRASMADPEQVFVCETLEELFEHSNCLFIVSTAANGEQKDALVPHCIESGKPLFVDKFLASNHHYAQKFLDMAAARGVVLISSSLLRLSEPVLEMKKELGARKPTRIVSTGWSGQNISGDIHPIAHLLTAAGDRKPVTVSFDTQNPPRTVVTFEDGLVGELVPPEEGAPFIVHVETPDGRFTATFQNEDLRAAAINQLTDFFGAVQGKHPPMPARAIVDYLAVWDAAQASKASGKPEPTYAQ